MKSITFLNEDTMGAPVNMNHYAIHNLATPLESFDAATKEYVDGQDAVFPCDWLVQRTDDLNLVALNKDTSENATGEINLDAALINSLSGHIYVACDIYPEVPIVINAGTCLEFNPGAKIYPASNFNVFHLKRNSVLKNPRVDTRAITFTGAVYFLSGADHTTFPELTSRIQNAHAIGNTGTGTGTALLLESIQASGGYICGIDAEIFATGYEYGCLMHCTGLAAENWTNSNNIRLVATDCVHFISQVHDGNETQGEGIWTGCAMDGNSFSVVCEWGAHTTSGIEIYGKYNNVYQLGLIWDVPYPTIGLHLGDKSAYNYIVSPCGNAGVSDEGVDNIVNIPLSFSWREHNHGTSTGTGSEQNILHNTSIRSIKRQRAWATYLVNSKYHTVDIDFDASYIYPNVPNGVDYEWRIE